VYSRRVVCSDKQYDVQPQSIMFRHGVGRTVTGCYVQKRSMMYCHRLLCSEKEYHPQSIMFRHGVGHTASDCYVQISSMMYSRRLLCSDME
jgi:hypothetical protein